MKQGLTVGEVVNGTLSVVGDNRRAAAIYVIVLTAGSSLFEWATLKLAPSMADVSDTSAEIMNLIGLGAGLTGILIALAGFVAQYLLWQTMLRKEGFLRDGARFRIFSFLAVIILLTILGTVGFVLLIVPGFIFMARWSAAVAFLISEDQGIIESMHSSWNTVRGSTTQVALAILAGVIIYYVIFGIAAGFAYLAAVAGSAFEIETLTLQALAQFGGSVTSVLQVALGVWVFGNLHSPGTELQETFA